FFFRPSWNPGRARRPPPEPEFDFPGETEGVCMRLIPWRGLGRWLAILTLVGPLGAAGCMGGGGGTGTVSGKVYYNGKELKGGTVTFVPADEASKFCRIGEDGSYTIQDVPTGE